MYVTSREVKNTKYVANFHTKAAADEYEAFLNSLKNVEKELVGVTRVRNSVVYTMECFKKGYTLAKQFEDDYIARMAPKPQPAPEPQPQIEIPVVDVVENYTVTKENTQNTEETEETAEQYIETENDVENEQEDEQKTSLGTKLTGFFKGNTKFNTN